MTATDADGHALTFAAPTLPSWLSFNGTNTISGTPQQANVGAHNVVVTVSDGIAPPVQQSFTITVSNVNDAPVAVADSYTTAEDTTLTVAAPGVLGNDTDPDTGTTLTAVLDTNVASGTLTLNANGSFTYVPAANFNGADSFTYHASDGTAVEQHRHGQHHRHRRQRRAGRRRRQLQHRRRHDPHRRRTRRARQRHRSRYGHDADGGARHHHWRAAR